MYFGHTKKVKKVIRNSQCGYTKNKQCLINLILFYDQMIALVDKGRGIEGIYLDFSKTFSTVSQNASRLTVNHYEWTIR